MTKTTNTREEAPAEAGERLLKPAGSKPTRCYCPPDRCDAPVIMGRQTPCLRAQPQAREETQPVGWLRAADEEMVCAHLGVAEAGDSYETAKKKLASLIQWNIAVATDPSVGGHPAPDALRVAVEKVRDQYKDQMRFCDIEPLPYFREFVRRIDAALQQENKTDD